MYYNIFQVYPESLKTQKNQTFSRGFLINFVLFLWYFNIWFILNDCENVYEKINSHTMYKMKKGGVKEI